MIAVIQRVSSAEVSVDGEIKGSCGRGYLILVGVAAGDTDADAGKLAAKTAKLRIFSDENGKMNRSVTDIGGGALVVSNFTLLANCGHGNRPDFFGAAKPDEAERLYDYFCRLLSAEIGEVGRGVFGADMRISLTADGPVTITLNSVSL